MTTLTQFQPAPVIDETVRLLTDHYVFPEAAEQLATLLRERLAQGAYDVDGAEEFGRLVTADLQSVNGDRHLRLIHHADQVPTEKGAATMAAVRRDFDTSLGGVPRLELLDGEVAVLELGPMLFPLEWASEPLTAALNLVSRARALIIDLRTNVGGDPDTVPYLCTYLLDERTHLNTMYWRDGDRLEQSWTLPHVPGARFGGSKPLYILTSSNTFSGAEDLAYTLQQLGRAVVVGESTRGGAHPREGWTVHPHLEVAIPLGRAINPVSGTNWEGTGVQPDIACEAAGSLDRAHALALERLAE
ncbi:S41 family peptidase [Streptomyces sp. NBC_01465]|uniref:S41 family peptidase n=1 Tax=Streptomyces sp. NBC_01465 TaxID=2903878 RepID=UPI002E31C8B4|nr:S41 family peptidase [Streptomyces sp. NBC_01465]